MTPLHQRLPSAEVCKKGASPFFIGCCKFFNVCPYSLNYTTIPHKVKPYFQKLFFYCILITTIVADNFSVVNVHHIFIIAFRTNNLFIPFPIWHFISPQFFGDFQVNVEVHQMFFEAHSPSSNVKAVFRPFSVYWNIGISKARR